MAHQQVSKYPFIHYEHLCSTPSIWLLRSPPDSSTVERKLLGDRKKS